MIKNSLVSRLIAISILMILLTVFVLSSVVYFGFSQNIKQQVQKNLASVAELTANQIISTLDFDRVNLLAMKTSEIMVDVVVDDLDKRIQHELINFKKNYQLQGELYLFNGKGILIASSQPGVLGNKLPEAWQVTQQQLRFVSRHSVSFVKPQELITAFVTELVVPGMQSSAYLVLTHPWGDIWNKLLSNEYQFAFYEKGLSKLELVTKEGVVSLNVDNDFKDKTTWLNDNKHYLSALSSEYKVGQLFFQIAAFVPENSLTEAQFELLKKLNIAACLVIFPLILITVILSYRFVRPIKLLTKTIKRIEQSNNLSLRVPVQGKDEVADLASAFNRLIDNLFLVFQEREKISMEVEDLNQNLELKVKNRTQELAATLEQLKAAQQKLVQSEKMTSLGQLVAGIAHEINNPIAAIYANVAPLKEYIGELQEAVALATKSLHGNDLQKFSQFLDEIDYDFVCQDLGDLLKSQQQATERIKNIVLALRNFSRLDQGKLKSVILEEGIDSTLQILQHQYKDKITLEKDYRLNIGVECYAGELNQVFMNILANAIQAIPEKGNIKIATFLKDGQAVITFRDSGLGISDDVKVNIFDPFFTTKEIGKGTGLGLSISYSIIEKHHGSLSVESVLNEWTMFTLSIPIHQTIK